MGAGGGGGREREILLATFFVDRATMTQACVGVAESPVCLYAGITLPAAMTQALGLCWLWHAGLIR